MFAQHCYLCYKRQHPECQRKELWQEVSKFVCDMTNCYIPDWHSYLQLSWSNCFVTHAAEANVWNASQKQFVPKKVNNSWYIRGVVTYIMHNTLCYVCNTPVMCYIHIKILCDIRQRQHQCFLCMQGQQYFSWDIFFMRGLGNIWDPSNFWHGEGGECWFHWCHFSCCICINVTHVIFLSFCYVCNSIAHVAIRLLYGIVFICDYWWSLSMGVIGFFQRSMFIW